ncbi:MAG: ABC transporter permease [Bacteroidales bacterium]|nr:ABC transporter permease [Bacteroidales bacterium]
MNFEFSIAKRLYGHRDDGHRLSRPAVTIAMWGVAVGLAVMILSVCIILGFKDEIRQKVIGFGGHIELLNTQSLVSPEAQPITADDSLMNKLAERDEVLHVQRFCTKTGLFKTEEAFKGVVLRGFAEEYDTTFLARHLITGRMPHFSSTQATNEIAVSSRIARTLGLEVGQKVYAYFFAEQVKARRFLIVGIYETHLREFDNSIVFTDFVTTQRINGWEKDQSAGLEIRIRDFNHLEEATSNLAAIMNHTQDHYGATYTTHSITELYPGLFSWLSLLDTNVYVILILMVLLSLFTMTAGLLIIILERTNFIAVMKSLGSSNTQVRRIFMYFAALLIGRGLLLGNLLGIGLAILQQQFGLVHLDPSTYYVDAVPIQFSWPLILLLNVATMAVTLLVLTIPSLLVSNIQPARVMRFE